MLTQRTGTQLSCLFISKHTELGKFCVEEEEESQTNKKGETVKR